MEKCQSSIHCVDADVRDRPDATTRISITDMRDECTRYTYLCDDCSLSPIEAIDDAAL